MPGRALYNHSDTHLEPDDEVKRSSAKAIRLYSNSWDLDSCARGPLTSRPDRAAYPPNSTPQIGKYPKIPIVCQLRYGSGLDQIAQPTPAQRGLARGLPFGMGQRAARSAGSEPHAKWTLGPLGERLTLQHLPPPGTRRWVIRRKAEVVCAVEGKLLTLDEAIQRYNITLTEYAAWKRAVSRHGIKGLRLTKVQEYRERERRFPDMYGCETPLTHGSSDAAKA